MLLSALTGAEIAIKHDIGRLSLPGGPQEFVPKHREMQGFLPLPLIEEDALVPAKIPVLHKDPFDRLLLAQSINQGMTILTSDPLIRQYAVRTL